MKCNKCSQEIQYNAANGEMECCCTKHEDEDKEIDHEYTNCSEKAKAGAGCE